MSMVTSPLLQELINALRCLPGVGPKTAQRMAFHLLQRERKGAHWLIDSLKAALDNVRHCPECRMLTELQPCAVCADASRDRQLLCVVESPIDVLAIEQTGSYRGLFFVLMGRLSPLDGMGPEALGMSQLSQKLRDEPIQEVIVATNATVEGEATAHYIAELVNAQGITVSRIAHGVPLGGELELVDGGTLVQAFAGRTRV